MLSKLGPYQKSVTALVAGALGWAAVVISSPTAPVTASEWLALGVVAAQALGVYAVVNVAKGTPTVVTGAEAPTFIDTTAP